ncbi:MAG: kelch repeat-containing protein [Anaerolineae bacterium]
MINRKSVRIALQAWKRADTLGQQPLAGLCIVEKRRIAANYADTAIGRGTALRDVLREAIDSLRPDRGPVVYTDDRWRPFIILTEQYIEGQPTGYLAGEMSIALSTYHHAQADALDTLAAILREKEESAAPNGQPGQPGPPTPAGPPDDSGVPSNGAASGSGSAGAAPPGPAQAAPARRAPWRAVAPWAAAALVILLLAVGWLALRQRGAASRAAVATIPFGQDRTAFIAANPVTGRVYVSLEDMPGVAVVDGATNAVLAKIPTQGYHKGIAVDGAANRIYVSQQFAGSVRIIDGADHSVVADLPVPDLVQTLGGVAVNPSAGRLYVIRANNNDVAVFDTATHTFLGAIAFGARSTPDCRAVPCDSDGIAVNEATGRVYVTQPAGGMLTVIDGATDTMLTTVPVGKGAGRIAVNPMTNTIYVTNSAEGTLTVVDGASHRVTATVRVEPGPIGLAVNPNTNRVYVANGESKTVSVIDGASNLVVATVPLAAPAELAAVLSTTGRLYVTTDSAHEVKVVEDPAPHFAVWVPLAAAGSPPTPRGDSAARPVGYDPAAHRLVVFGGMKQGGALLNDTWVLADADGTTGAPHWIELATANTPPPRRSHAGAYDAAHNRLITYGGCLGGCTPIDNNVYVLTNANGLGGSPTWTQLQPTGGPPPPRNGHTAVYDPASNRLIVFGGDDCCGQRYNDTWVLTNANGLGGTPEWIQLAPAGERPAGRVSHSAVYDAANNRMIVFGGAAADGQFNDVWVLSGANGAQGTPTWSRLAPVGAPPSARNGHSAVYDDATGQMLIFGGGDADGLRNDTWTLSHANGLGGAPTWRPLTPAGSAPASRVAASAIYRPASNRLVLFGGDTKVGSLNDTWTLVNAMPAGE